MTTINDRIGSQNVIRVLSNASAPPTRLANLSDVNSTRKTEDGLILVWDLAGEKFVLTDTIDAATIIQTGITSITNTTNSTSSTTGALTVERSSKFASYRCIYVYWTIKLCRISHYN